MPSIPSSGDKTRTVFISILQGVEALHILRTQVYVDLVARADIRIVLFVASEERKAYYAKQFPESDRLAYEVVGTYREGRLGSFFSGAKVTLLRTDTMDIKRRITREQGVGTLAYVRLFVANRLLARPLVRRLARWGDERLVRDQSFAAVFDRYQPDLVFLAHLFADEEVAMLREAKRRRIVSIGFINSWDKLTARSIMRILPDWLVVPNLVTREEAVRYQDMPVARIQVTGAPQFDLYRQLEPTPREHFCRALAVDPSARLVLFCPIGKTYSEMDWSMLELLNRFMDEGRLPADLHILVRFPPNDTVEMREGISRERFSFVMPGVRFSRERGVDWDMTEEDLQSLIDNVYHAALVVCPFSTMSIDAAILDKPIININFSPVPLQTFYRMPSPFYRMTHYRRIVDTGGIRLVGSADELFAAIGEYLAHPEHDARGRAEIRHEQLWREDGKAGKRIAEFIACLLP